MSTSSPPRTPATGLIPVDWRRPRRLWVRIGAVLLALVVAVAAWQVVHEDDGPGLAGRSVATASSARLGFAPHAAVDAGDVRAPRASWHSNGETLGAWLELSWSDKYEMQQVVLVRNALDEPGVTAGFLTFGDGSQLQVTLSSTSAETVVPFSPRAVDKLRFTASAVSDGAREIQIAEMLVATSADEAVAIDEVPDGNAAFTATPTVSAGDPRALQDGSGGAAGSPWFVDPAVGGWAQFDWEQPQEIASVELVGAAGRASISRATLSFGDGTHLPVGAVLAEPGRPTVVGFMPRVTRSLRLTVDEADDAGMVALGELRVHRRGVTPTRTPTPAPPSAPVANPACEPSATPPAGKLVVSCPVAGSTIDGTVPLRISAPGFSAVTVTAWPSGEADHAGPPVRAAPDAAGTADLAVDLGDLPPGPVTVRVEATADGRDTATAYFPLYRRGAGGGDVASSPAAAGRTMVYAEEFDRPLSITRSGADADYAAAKPEHGGVEDFGEAIFADPGKGFDNVRVVDDRYLRIDVEPTPPGYSDPQGWGRTHLGGMLASARPGGSGFSAQYGYFEARMLLPASTGTWPAFWMLPSDNLITPTPVVAEIDALEHYGHNPRGTCHTTHDYNSPHDDGVARCAIRFESDRDALSWHTYGVSVLPSAIVFYIDGQVVATAPQVDRGGSPMFFLVNLALGGGWPVDLGAVQDRATLYVDYVRVYV